MCGNLIHGHTLLGMQVEGMSLKALSITARINLCPNQGDEGLKTGADSTSNITKHNELRSPLLMDQSLFHNLTG
jgi:hypothetical protein